MPVAYKDYYKVLGVDRRASAEDIRRAYHTLARAYHPDRNKGRGAEDRFREVTEAYEVLGDPAKRKRFDQLGANWRAGQPFAPPRERTSQHHTAAGHGHIFEEFGGGRQAFGGGFSDFFEALFGAGPSSHAHPLHNHDAPHGADYEAELTISLEDAYHGAVKSIALPGSHLRYDVHIHPGTLDGSRFRLKGLGGHNSAGGHAGDLVLRIKLAPHPVFRAIGQDLEVDLTLPPWDAALGASATVRTMDGRANVRIPAGAQPGQRLRLKGKGFPTSEGGHGDLLVVLQIHIPQSLTAGQRRLWEELRRKS